MISKQFFASKSINRVDGVSLHLFYFIIHSDAGYGIEIRMKCDGIWHRAAVSDITASVQSILSLAHTLYAHAVTPCTLQDIVLDSLNKY